MRVVSALRVLQTVSGRQQLVELVVEQAFLEQAPNTADPDTVDRLLQCARQALPLFSVSVCSRLCGGLFHRENDWLFFFGRKMSIPLVLLPTSATTSCPT